MKMVIFYSYVSLPEGTERELYNNMVIFQFAM